MASSKQKMTLKRVVDLHVPMCPSGCHSGCVINPHPSHAPRSPSTQEHLRVTSVGPWRSMLRVLRGLDAVRHPGIWGMEWDRGGWQWKRRGVEDMKNVLTKTLQHRRIKHVGISGTLLLQ